jgi:predicted GTPase
MALENDYFLLYHGVQFSPNSTDETIEIVYTPEVIAYYAIILMIGRKKFEKFQTLESFTHVCQALKVETPKDLSSLHLLQYQLIHTLQIHNSVEMYTALQDTFLNLFHENVLKKENYKKLYSLFTYTKRTVKVEKDTDKKHFLFTSEKEKISDYIAVLKNEFSTLVNLQTLETIQTTLEAQTFSIGITGVMNAGKSTMINALLGQEILGTSVVPETANLTLLKYNTKPQAKVHYWNTEEWSNIAQTASKLTSMKAFVQETEDAFSENLERYIQATSRVDNIDVSELSQYTSAKDSAKKCNLIKYVTLENDLAFLKENVEIVDTPGLDDPVIQREEITKSYIARCDMLFHLMNVSQSASQKDITFLLDALLYQNITKLLIVITRADTVDKEALDEVISYTKQSIKAELKRQNRENRLDGILESIEFIAISAKVALLCKTDEAKAVSLGLTLESSGFPALERYLHNNLFGYAAVKSQLMIASAQKKLLNEMRRYREILQYQLEVEAKSKEELQSQWDTFVLDKKHDLQDIHILRKELDHYQKMLNGYRHTTLVNFLTTAFYELQGIVRQRLISDIRYAFEKTKKTPDTSRTTVIIQTAVKDGIIDIVREYKYKLAKKMEEIADACLVKYKSLGLLEVSMFEMEIFLASHFQQGYLTHSSEVLVQEILSVMSKSKAKEIPKLDREIQQILSSQLTLLESEIKTKADSEAEVLIGAFCETLNIPLQQREEKIESEERTLSSRLSLLEKGKVNSTHAIAIHEKMKKLDLLLMEIKGDAHGVS